MVSIVFFSILLFIDILLMAWVLAFLARRAGSTRGTFGAGLICILALTMLCALFVALDIWSTDRVQYRLQLAVLLASLQLIAQYHFIKWWFGLRTRAYIPFVGMNVANIVVPLALAFPFRSFLTEAFVLPTRSMMPTLNPGDRFMVNKRLHPRRWDLVAYISRDGTTPGATVVYCKRLIALPGERLRFDNGTIFINDQPVAVPAVLAGKCHAAIPNSTYSKYADAETIALGPDEFFFVGDKIDISADSRVYGPSHASAIIGVIDVVYWPVSAARIVR